MYQLLKINDLIKLSTGNSCKITGFLGSGSQGEVYKVESGGKAYALKWYFEYSSEQKTILQTLLKNNAPNRNFLWPLALAYHDHSESFGYLMAIRPSNYASINMLMCGKVDIPFRTLVTACFNLADSFFQLHAKGFAYKDISFSNAFINPETGDILICDNDNVCFDGQDLVTVNGTLGFMAPEIVRNEATPSKYTDLFSLAILLFYMLYFNHPLEGMKESAIHCFDFAAKRKLYGIEPVFIFDPYDSSNKPDPDRHAQALTYWGIYPLFINELFTKVFTLGLKDPKNGRVEEGIWRKALIRLRDCIIYCDKCGVENFYDLDKAKKQQSIACWNQQCKHLIALPFRMRFGNHICMLNHDTKLFPHHTHEKPYDFTIPTAEVSIHPLKKIWGLKNLSTSNWTLITNENKSHIIESGKTASLVNGHRINFGKVEAEIRF